MKTGLLMAAFFLVGCGGGSVEADGGLTDAVVDGGTTSFDGDVLAPSDMGMNPPDGATRCDLGNECAPGEVCVSSYCVPAEPQVDAQPEPDASSAVDGGTPGPRCHAHSECAEDEICHLGTCLEAQPLHFWCKSG